MRMRGNNDTKTREKGKKVGAAEGERNECKIIAHAPCEAKPHNEPLMHLETGDVTPGPV